MLMSECVVVQKRFMLICTCYHHSNNHHYLFTETGNLSIPRVELETYSVIHFQSPEVQRRENFFVRGLEKVAVKLRQKW